MSPEVAPRRCAIYTRKSGEEGLDRDYNSLTTQREVCSAYISSQRHKGWTELPDAYDDGGQSGGTTERPALRQLLRDIEAGQVDVIVIYKVDRLTRSIADFVRLADLFDRFGVSFVSVTQSFDTSDSMGRMVLNVLLTFAQFEREMLIDRIRDKIAVMRRRGQHTGGQPPLGYDLVDRRLVINPAEAERVRHIFRRYLELGCYNALCDELAAQGARSKRFVTRAGVTRGGGPISSGMIHHMLRNVVYFGKVPYRGELYDGEHEPILDAETWEAVCALRERRAHRPPPGPSPHLLLGLMVDAHGRRMGINGLVQNGRRYRYYYSAKAGWATEIGLRRYRVRAELLEDLVLTTIKDVLASRDQMRAALVALGRGDSDLVHLPERGAGLCELIAEAGLLAKREILVALIVRGDISREKLRLHLRCAEVERLLCWDRKGLFRGQRAAWGRADATLSVEVPVSGILSHQHAVVIPAIETDPATVRKVQPGLVRLIREMREAQARFDAAPARPLPELAAEFGCQAGKFARLVRLNYLAPDIVAAILEGTQPPGLTRQKLTRAHLPMEWALQRRMFGFAARPDHQLPRTAAPPAEA